MVIVNKSIPKKRNLLVFGAYGGVNLGDEIILRAICARARSEGYHDVINVVVGRFPDKAGLDADYTARNIKPISYRRPLALLKATFNRDVYIGGGQVIDGVAGMQLPLLQVLIALFSRATGGQVSILGSSTARLDQWSVRMVYRFLFALSNKIELRDTGSAQEVSAICPGSIMRITATADFVFSIRDQIVSSVSIEDRRLILFSIYHAPKLQLTSI